MIACFLKKLDTLGVILCNVGIQLSDPHNFLGVVLKRFQRIGSIAVSPVFLFVNQDTHSGTLVKKIDVEEVDRPDSFSLE